MADVTRVVVDQFQCDLLHSKHCHRLPRYDMYAIYVCQCVCVAGEGGGASLYYPMIACLNKIIFQIESDCVRCIIFEAGLITTPGHDTHVDWSYSAHIANI